MMNVFFFGMTKMKNNFSKKKIINSNCVKLLCFFVLNKSQLLENNYSSSELLNDDLKLFNFSYINKRNNKSQNDCDGVQNKQVILLWCCEDILYNHACVFFFENSTACCRANHISIGHDQEITTRIQIATAARVQRQVCL